MKNHTQIFSILLLIGYLQFGCKSSDQDIGLPACIIAQIEAIKNEPIRNPSAEVWKWEDNSKVFYYFNSPCCDQYNYLYNENCEVVCAPDGGFTGKGDEKCPEFEGDINRSLIWKDERKG